MSKTTPVLADFAVFLGHVGLFLIVASCFLTAAALAVGAFKVLVYIISL